MKLYWDKRDVPFLEEQMKFCVEHYMKTRNEELKESYLILKDIYETVKGKDNRKSKKRQVVVKWC